VLEKIGFIGYQKKRTHKSTWQDFDRGDLRTDLRPSIWNLWQNKVDSLKKCPREGTHASPPYRRINSVRIKTVLSIDRLVSGPSDAVVPLHYSGLNSRFLKAAARSRRPSVFLWHMPYHGNQLLKRQLSWQADNHKSSTHVPRGPIGCPQCLSGLDRNPA